MKGIRRTANWMTWSLAVLLLGGPWALGQDAPPVKPGNNEGIQLNFRGAPLDTVLDYLSEAAGFVIVKEADLSGTVDVWSHQPLSRDEAVNLLNTILNEKGYAAIRNDRTLTIVRREEAQKRDIPVRTGNNPAAIPKNDEIVTQIIPVRYTNAVTLVENLQPLMPSYATLSANESSNAILITDTQKNIRKMTEIIQALDSSISSISTVRVFPLVYADASELVQVIEKIFATETGASSQRGGRFPVAPFFNRGGRGGGDQGSEGSGQSEARSAASRVVAVADERTNSLVVSAPEELMPVIEQVVQEVDVVTDDITEIAVFHLQHADATETAQILTNLFPETSTQTNQIAPRFGGGMRGGPGSMPGMPGGAGGTVTDQSQRQLQQTTVRAVADPRTNSVIVYAASTTMEQIRRMIAQLDSRTDKKQKVFVYRLDYADVENVSEILRNMFENNLYGTSSRTTRSTTAGGTATGSTLSNRNMQQSSFQLNTQNSNR
ncbi:MAG TPA: secretin N-terminal domain-containing protein [bacterium]|nr:secretin N-terminal domain-containing protein [bacterium]